MKPSPAEPFASPQPVEAVPAYSFQPRRPPRYKSRGERAAPPEPPPPPPPVEPAVVLSTFVGGQTVVFTFDRPVALVDPPPPFDDGLTVGGQAPESAEVMGGGTDLSMNFADVVEPGMAWAIAAQPGWIATEVLVPQEGTL